jgi:ribosome maturation factor RimP
MSDELIAELEPVVAQFGLDLDELRLTKAGKRRVLEVVLDGDNGVDLDVVAAVSRAISEHLDASTIMGQLPYLLEVGSRGVGRPLTKPAHWSRNVGRMVHVVGDAIDVTGRIVAFNDPQVTLDVEGSERVVDFTTISRALIEVEFNRKATEDQFDDIDEEITDEDVHDETDGDA